jgi:hypothetical protein
MDPSVLRASDPAVAARYLQLRSLFHNRLLARVEQLVAERYQVQATTRVHPTLVALVRSGFVRPGEGELWPIVFLTAVDVSLVLAVQLSAERVGGLGTSLKGPTRLRHRHWEDWWGWETPLADARPDLYQLTAAEQEEALLAWYAEGLEWLANNGLMRRRLQA